MGMGRKKSRGNPNSEETRALVRAGIRTGMRTDPLLGTGKSMGMSPRHVLDRVGGQRRGLGL